MHAAVLGAGYAGLSLARQLEDALPPAVAITVVEERDTHLVQHLIHRVVRRPELATELRRPLADLLDRATHRRARVEGVDPDAGRVELDDGKLGYDVGAVCLGARTNFHDLPGVEAHATPFKRASHALAVRERFLELCDDGGRVVVGGAGLSGVQVAGELAALARERGATDAVDVCLVEQQGHVAPSLPAPFRRVVASELRDRGVTVETAVAVERADDETVALSDGSERAYDQFVWTGGIAGRTALGGERPRVQSGLRLGDRMVGLGDAVQVVDAEGSAVPPSANTALGQADVAATNVARLVEYRRNGGRGFERRLARYRYDARGWLVSVGDGAVAQVGPAVLRGSAARAVKSTVSERYLASVRPDRGLVSTVREALGSGD